MNVKETDSLLQWAVDRWKAEVEHRPLVNVHRAALDSSWRQMVRRLGGDPDALLGPDHQTLVSARNEHRRAILASVDEASVRMANENAKLRKQMRSTWQSLAAILLTADGEVRRSATYSAHERGILTQALAGLREASHERNTEEPKNG